MVVFDFDIPCLGHCKGQRMASLQKILQPAWYIQQKEIILLTFTSKWAEALIKSNKPKSAPRPVGRPSQRSLSLDNLEAPKRGRAPKSALPDLDSRFDLLAHWPEYKDRKKKGRSYTAGYSRVYSGKCQLCLCLTSTKNCFRNFHTK